MTNTKIKEDKPKVLITACIHGNEPLATATVMWYIGNMLQNYSLNDKIKKDTGFSFLTRIEEHLRFLKKADHEQQRSLDSIEAALIGNSFNDNKGLTHTVANIDLRLKTLEAEYIITKDNMSVLKWFTRIIITTIVGFLVWLIQSNK